MAAAATSPAVHPYRPAFEAEAADTLTEAFADDPVFRYMFPAGVRRVARIRWLLTRWLRAMAPRAWAWTVDEGRAGVMLSLPAGTRPDVEFWEQVRRPLPPLRLRGAARVAGGRRRSRRLVAGPPARARDQYVPVRRGD